MGDRHKYDRCPICGGAKRRECATCYACDRGEPGRRIPWAEYVCPYADEKITAQLYGNRLFCTACPDIDNIPEDCDGWHCETCDRECPCHTTPTLLRVFAHERYWKEHVVVVHMPEHDGPTEKSKRVCVGCGKPVSEASKGMCRKCASKERERVRREQRELQKEMRDA